MLQTGFSVKIDFLHNRAAKDLELRKAEDQGRIYEAKYHHLQKERIVLQDQY